MENSKNTLALELRSTFLLSRTSSKVLLHSLVQFFPPPLYLKWVHCHDVMDVTCITKLCLGWTKADYIVLTATDRCSKKIENWYVRANGTFIGFTLKRSYTVCAKCLWLFTRWHWRGATLYVQNVCDFSQDDTSIWPHFLPPLVGQEESSSISGGHLQFPVSVSPKLLKSVCLKIPSPKL